MFAGGIDKSRYEDLLRQTFVVQGLFEAALRPFLPEAEVVGRAAELWSLAHGVATLALQGNLQHVVDAGRGGEGRGEHRPILGEGPDRLSRTGVTHSRP